MSFVLSCPARSGYFYGAEAKGAIVLSWEHALDKAAHWFELQKRGGVESAPNLTSLAEAIDMPALDHTSHSLSSFPPQR